MTEMSDIGMLTIKSGYCEAPGGYRMFVEIGDKVDVFEHTFATIDEVKVALKAVVRPAVDAALADMGDVELIEHRTVSDDES